MLKKTNKLPKIIVILGPTASGKTELSLKLAKEFNGEIIVADSRTVYQEMNIGTAKINGKKQGKAIVYQNIPHYLIDIIKPTQSFSVAQFKEKALRLIHQIVKKGKIPFLVGGTGLYIQSIVDNLMIPEIKADHRLRNKLNKELKEKGLEFLVKKLLKLDPQAKDLIDFKNPRRVIRALEICLKSGQLFSQQRNKGEKLVDVLQIGITYPKEKLYQRISLRTDLMIKQGLVQEIQRLVKKYPLSSPGFSGIGYQELIPYLNQKITLDQAIEEIKKDTRHYAKRQTTWFKKDQRINWVKNYFEAKKLAKRFILDDS